MSIEAKINKDNFRHALIVEKPDDVEKILSSTDVDVNEELDLIMQVSKSRMKAYDFLPATPLFYMCHNLIVASQSEKVNIVNGLTMKKIVQVLLKKGASPDIISQTHNGPFTPYTIMEDFKIHYKFQRENENLSDRQKNEKDKFDSEVFHPICKLIAEKKREILIAQLKKTESLLKS